MFMCIGCRREVMLEKRQELNHYSPADMVPANSGCGSKRSLPFSYGAGTPAKFRAIDYIEGSALILWRKPDVAEMQTDGLEVLETRERLHMSRCGVFDYVLPEGGPERAGRLLQQFSPLARRAAGVNFPFTATTPYQNTIASRQ